MQWVLVILYVNSLTSNGHSVSTRMIPMMDAKPEIHYVYSAVSVGKRIMNQYKRSQKEDGHPGGGNFPCTQKHDIRAALKSPIRRYTDIRRSKTLGATVELHS